MGLSLSVLLSPWCEILNQKFFSLTNTIKTAIMKSSRFKRQVLETPSSANTTNKTNVERSTSMRKSESREANAEVSEKSESLIVEEKRPVVKKPMIRSPEGTTMQIQKPTILLPKPVIMFSPRPTSELDAAATKLQKVYKSYRTRRNLADCAVVIEELWWKALDFAALKRSSVWVSNVWSWRCYAGFDEPQSD